LVQLRIAPQNPKTPWKLIVNSFILERVLVRVAVLSHLLRYFLVHFLQGFLVPNYYFFHLFLLDILHFYFLSSNKVEVLVSFELLQGCS